MEQVITQDMALFFDQCHPTSLYGIASEDEEKKYEIAVRKTEGNVITFCLADRTTSHIVPLTMERVFSASEAETDEPVTEFFREYLNVLINRKYQIYRFANRQEYQEFFEESKDNTQNDTHPVRVHHLQEQDHTTTESWSTNQERQYTV